MRYFPRCNTRYTITILDTTVYHLSPKGLGALPLTTEKLTTELGSSSPSRKRALATEYAAELEAQFKTYCRLTSITTIPVMPAIAAGEDWATSMASWIVTQTNSKRSGGLGDDLPRAGAMQKLSKDTPTWNIFLKRLGAAGALGFTAPEAEQAGPLALARSLDKTLERFGDKTDAAAILPAVMTSADKLDADQLMDKFFDLRGTNTTVERESNQGKHEHSRRTTFVGVQAAIDTSGSETEQAARSVTLQAGMSIQDSPQEIKALKAIEDQVSNNDAMIERRSTSSRSISGSTYRWHSGIQSHNTTEQIS